jgi:hypothetical protein
MGGVISDTLSSTLPYVLSTPHVPLPVLVPPLLRLLSHYVPDMSTLFCQHMYCYIYSDMYCYIYSDIYVDIFSHMYVEVSSGVYVRVLVLGRTCTGSTEDMYVEGYLECTWTCACKYANW